MKFSQYKCIQPGMWLKSLVMWLNRLGIIQRWWTALRAADIFHYLPTHKWYQAGPYWWSKLSPAQYSGQTWQITCKVYAWGGAQLCTLHDDKATCDRARYGNIMDELGIWRQQLSKCQKLWIGHGDPTWISSLPCHADDGRRLDLS